MKKLIGIIALAIGLSAQAGGLEVSAQRDFAGNKNIFSATTQVAGFDAGVSHVDGVYTRVQATKQVQLVKYMGATLNAGGGFAYQSSDTGRNGVGAVVGANIQYPLYKNLSAVAGVERFIGQDRVAGSTGNTVSAGLTYKF